jgi:predicted transcriptional regulator
MSKEIDDSSVLALTARIVSAHVSNNSVQSEGLPSLIQLVYSALANAGTEAVEAEKPMPAVPIKRSVFPDYIVCLEDGKKLKMLKRHLDASYNMTPAQYRERWGLPPDYPMVAPNYAERRSALAKQIGLGRKPVEPVEEPVKTPAKRGRKPKDAA